MTWNQTRQMVPIGYMYKRVALRPDWLEAGAVRDIYSLSGCISEYFADYINFWRHNGYWLFDSPEIMEKLAKEHSFSLDGLSLFYYEAYEHEYEETQKAWIPFAPEESFTTNVRLPKSKTLEGFDVTCFSVRTSPECSPLSCSLLASELPVNEHCLFETFDVAREAIERGAFEDSEPGPYRIIAVYSMDRGR